jgi:(p)ppGpp synthase/HD superfamily hydrolase
MQTKNFPFVQPDLSHPMLQRAYAFAGAAHAAIGQLRKYTKEPYIVHPVECVGILQALPASSGITLAQLVAVVNHDTVEDTRRYVDEAGNPVLKPSEAVRKGTKIFLVEGITFDLIQTVFGYEDPEFGAEVVRITSGLTDVSMPWDGNREVRKKIDLDHTAAQAPDVKTNKLADILSNSTTIVAFDPGFARKWMAEKSDLLPALKDGDPILFDALEKLLENYWRSRNS